MRLLSFLRVTVLLPTIILSGCTGLHALNAVVPARGYDRTTNLPFGPLARQKLDVYRPRKISPPAPVVIFFYGGEWKNGDKESYRFVGQAYSSRGFVTVLPDYRLYPQVTFPEFVKDGAASVRWVHDHIADFGGDPNRVYLVGHSAGAQIAALLTLDAHYLKEAGLNDRAIRATASIAGPLDFKPFNEDRATFNQPPGDPNFDPAIEAVNFARGDAPPMLLVQGLKDTTVRPSNAEHLAAKIKDAGGDVTLIEYPKRGHIGVMLALAYPFRCLAPTLKDTVEFFHAH